MSKILMLFFTIFLIFSINSVSAEDDINIISRQEWGAVEDYRFLDSEEWKSIIDKKVNKVKTELTPNQKIIAEKEAKKMQLANNYLLNSYPELHKISEIVKYDNGHKLAWPIAKSKIKNSIVVHHTDSDYYNSYDAVKKIYKYHSITKERGDIGYNFLIGYDGEIFEGRAGGDYSVGAHDKWNNQFSIGIALIGNYQHKDINFKQSEALEKLITYLVKKHNIDLSEKVPYFKWCIGNDICNTKPINTIEHYPIIGHRDAGHTDCPGDELYGDLLNLKEKLISEYKSDKYYILKQKLSRVDQSKLIDFLALIEEKIDKTTSENKLFLLNKIKLIILNIENKKINDFLQISNDTFDDNNKIKVKLSYPTTDLITLKIDGNYVPDLSKKTNEYILEFKKANKYRHYTMNFKFLGNKLYLNNKEILGFSQDDFFRIKGVEDKYLTISSWDRKPNWDKTGLYNDNKFRGDIILYKKDSKLLVINELILTHYLKGLGEVSNNTNVEKIKSIIILARTYARWYMTKAEKFAQEWYHASDDPNVFQKYLGYGLEERSPNVNKIVDETKDLIITYDGELIKPWYFSSSDGYTKNFVDFCKESKGVLDCSNPKSFPFLVGVKDLGSNGSDLRGHGVGVPGTGVQYFSEKGWNFNMIIKYFLKGVEIGKL